REAISRPIRFAGPMEDKPGHELPLSGFRQSGGLDRLAVIFGRLVTIPLIPMAADTKQGAAQQGAFPEAFLAPVPKGPKPDETHRSLLCALCDSRICIGAKNKAKGHSVGDLKLLPLRRNFLREFGIDSIFVFNRQNRVCG